MNKILIFLLIFELCKATSWNFTGGLNGEDGLMIVYKTLPPLSVEVDQPEVMIVPASNAPFRYSEVNKNRNLLEVRIEIRFNKEIIETNNAVNKKIVRSVYDRAKLNFKDDGIFYLEKINSKKIKKDVLDEVNNKIDGEVFFTTAGGVDLGKEITEKIGDTIQNGTLSKRYIYIDAKFNKEGKQLMLGEYKGTATLVVEFLGKEIGE